mmetsp:Transcript_11347/g.26161  ORF Transcript_11347/g.26161 Transcript_11347/m.26161 type:complete len:905 (-) Transcript_11347:54-2768(-)
MEAASTSSKYDVFASKVSEDDLGFTVAETLTAKGVCVVDAGIEQVLLHRALEDIAQLESADVFYEPHELLLDGLLGGDGSSRIAELDVPKAQSPSASGEHLVQLDELITHLGSVTDAWLPVHLGCSVPTRSFGIVHATGTAEEKEEAPPLPVEEVSRWLYQFVRHRIMVIICIGPEGVSLDLNPFDDESNPFTLSLVPGDVVLLRPDVMLHSLTDCSDTSYLLTAFLLQETKSDRRSAEALARQMTPCAKALDAYAMNELLELKEHEDKGAVAQKELPPEIISTMNHYCFKGQRIAIRGSALRLPSSWSSSAWFRTTLMGSDVLQAVPLQRWDNSQHYDPDWESWREMKTWTRHGGFLEGAELFDCKFFGISIAEARGMDPNQRFVLEVGYEALHSAGYTKKELMRSVGGVYIAATFGDWGFIDKEYAAATGGSVAIVANRFSFCLGIQGPSIASDTEQAGGLTSVHLACEATVNCGRGVVNSYSLAGAASLLLSHLIQVQLQGLRMMSATGRCFSFDASADGLVRSESAGMVVAKRLAEVVDGQTKVIEGEPLLGVVAGTSMAHGGRSATMTAPNAPQILDVVQQTLANAGIENYDVDAVEGIGMGHLLVDAIEFGTLARAFRSYEEPDPIGLLSTKCYVGTSMDAAPMQSFIKALHCGSWGCLPGNLHIAQLNPHVEWTDATLVGSEVYELPLASSYNGVSAFGIGGAFVHACIYNRLMEEPDGEEADGDGENLWSQQFSFWPGGGGALDADSEAVRGYYITGTFTKDVAVPMQGGDSMFTYTATLGENGWEEFQILLDGNPKKVLHPYELYARRLTPVYGPSSPEEEGISECRWCINPDENLLEDFEPESQESPAADGKASPGDAEKTSDGSGRTWKAGDRYEIRLLIAGKYRVVDWELLK